MELKMESPILVVLILVCFSSILRAIIFCIEVGLKRKYSREAKNFLNNAFAHLEQAKVLATNNEIRNKRFKDLEKDFQRIEHERRCKICWSQQSNTLF